MFLATDWTKMKLEEENTIMKPASSQKAISTVEPRMIEEKVRARAYELFNARGREDGRDLEDWLRAEEEVTGRTSSSAAA